jgi:hypothetical protein
MSSPSPLRRFAVPAVALGLAISALACEVDKKQEGGKVSDTTVTTAAPAPTTAATAKPTTTTTAKPATTTTTAKPATTATTAKPVSTVSFDNCSEAKAAGYQDIRRGQPGYADHLDRNNDGIACES